MGTVDIPHPVAGWNPVPGDPGSMVWWDGSAFTHQARYTAEGWSVVVRSIASNPAFDLLPHRTAEAGAEIRGIAGEATKGVSFPLAVGAAVAAAFIAGLFLLFFLLAGLAMS